MTKTTLSMFFNLGVATPREAAWNVWVILFKTMSKQTNKLQSRTQNSAAVKMAPVFKDRGEKGVARHPKNNVPTVKQSSNSTTSKSTRTKTLNSVVSPE